MRKLKVIGVPWHIGHQYELAKLPFMERYDLLMNPYRSWASVSRPMPENVHNVVEYKKGYYDFAILHVDQQSIYDLDAGDRISKGKLFLQAKEIIGDDIPIVVINHMTPFHDKYDSDYVVRWIKDATKGAHMVVNSYQAAQQWGWGYPIIHGMDASEWHDLPKEPRAIVVLTPHGMEKAYRRIFLHQVKRRLDEVGVPLVWVGVDIKFKTFEDYRDYVGSSLVFFNPTWQSPRPRARTEAMLSGCCVVTTPYHDADTFIEEGKNGFLTGKRIMDHSQTQDNPDYAAKLIQRLVMEDPDEALRVGQAGKQTAMELFNQEEFAKQWVEFLESEVGIKVK